MRPAIVAKMIASGEEERRWPSLPLTGLVAEALAEVLDAEVVVEEDLLELLLLLAVVADVEAEPVVEAELTEADAEEDEPVVVITAVAEAEDEPVPVILATVLAPVRPRVPVGLPEYWNCGL